MWGAVVFWVSRLPGKKMLNWLYRRFPHIEGRIILIINRLSNRSPIAVALPRLIGLYFPTSIAAGIINLPYRSFAKGVALSMLIFDGAVGILGVAAGDGFRILGFTPYLWAVIAVFIAVMLIIVLVIFRKSRKVS